MSVVSTDEVFKINGSDKQDCAKCNAPSGLIALCQGAVFKAVPIDSDNVREGRGHGAMRTSETWT